jgi:hypothetical protein
VFGRPAVTVQPGDPVHWTPMEPSTAPRPPFAHASEAEFARILDFYEVRWEYEPHIFPILWNLDGLVVESFAPDFWLPDLELYIEMTTLKQSLVRKKNRKLRRLRELYPGIRIKLFYGRDFRALMLKYGQHGLIGAMSGTLGQSTPPRLATVIGAEEDLIAPVAPLSPAADGQPRSRPPALQPAEAAITAAVTAPVTPAALPGPSAPRRSRRRRAGRAAAARAAAAAATPVKTDG